MYESGPVLLVPAGGEQGLVIAAAGGVGKAVRARTPMPANAPRPAPMTGPNTIAIRPVGALALGYVAHSQLS